MAPPVVFQFSQLRLHHRPVLASSSSFPGKTPAKRTLHARDFRIDIGKYKGLMLGTLPSSYLKWLAKHVDVDPSPLSLYSDLAKLVLKDPVYKDRIEWEPAQRLFSGDMKGSFVYDGKIDVMKAYRDIGERFGWDMDDKEGWKKVKRDYIGTSFSGRIPRKNGEKRIEKAKEEVGSVRSVKAEERVKKRVGVVVGGKRAVRIERMKVKREMNQKMLENVEKKLELEVSEELNSDDETKEKEKVKFPTIRQVRASRRKKKASNERNTEHLSEGNMELGEIKTKSNVKRTFGLANRNGKKGNSEVFNPFPGRESLFEKAKRNES